MIVMHTTYPNKQARQYFAEVLQQDEVFQAFSDASKQQFLHQARYQHYLPEQALCYQQQTSKDVWVLLAGTLQIGWLQDSGQVKVSHYFNQRSVFNLVALIQNQPMSYDYFAMDRVHIAVLSGELFFHHLKAEPDAMWQILQIMTQRMYFLFQHHHYIHIGDVPQRIAHHLLTLKKQQSPRHTPQNECILAFKMSQQAFAALLNVSRQTLNKHIQNLQKQGILQWHYRHVHILDLASLHKLSQLN